MDAKVAADQRSHKIEIIEATHPEGVPSVKPNVRIGHEYEDILALVNGDDGVHNNGCWWLPSILCCCIPICKNAKLIDAGDLGLVMNSGKPQILVPGWNFLLSPLAKFQGTAKLSQDTIRLGQLTIVRVAQGSVRFAFLNSRLVQLQAGTHVLNDPSFKMVDPERRPCGPSPGLLQASVDPKNEQKNNRGNKKDKKKNRGQQQQQQQNVISVTQTQDFYYQYGPMAIVEVAAGTVRVCYDGGVVRTFSNVGWYWVNNPNFRVGETISTQQQSLHFDAHRVLLDGGINLLVEGLLTFQVVDVKRLITLLGAGQLTRVVTDVTKAELARLFAGIHLEQISTGGNQQQPQMQQMQQQQQQQQQAGRPGGQRGASVAQRVDDGGVRSRSWLCAHIIAAIAPILKQSGVRVINFQLEQMTIADQKYAEEYQEASLALATVTANARALQTENEIKIQKATNSATTLAIEAEARKQMHIKEAEARAEARLVEARAAAQTRKLEAQARNQAAATMTDDFAKQLALADRQVEMAASLHAGTLVVTGPDMNIFND